MDRTRNYIIKLKEYFLSLGLEINIAKNTARGNKGVFLNKHEKYRIDISKSLNDEEVLSTMLHEFAHYIHYKKDKTLVSLDSLLGNVSEVEMEELINITVQNIPKEYALSLYDKKNKLKSDNNYLEKVLKSNIKDFKSSVPCSSIEKTLSIPQKYLLKYDNINYYGNLYSISNLENQFINISELQKAYILFKSNKRKISRINSKINRLNKYYNSPTELWARFFSLYFIDKNKAENIAPNISCKFTSLLANYYIDEISIIKDIMFS